MKHKYNWCVRHICGANQWARAGRLGLGQSYGPILRGLGQPSEHKHLRGQTATVTRWHKHHVSYKAKMQAWQYRRLHGARPAPTAVPLTTLWVHFSVRRLAHNWSCKDESRRETFHAKLNNRSNYRFKKKKKKKKLLNICRFHYWN